MISQLLFLLILAAAVYLFSSNIRKLIRNIRLGRNIDRSDRSGERWMTMIRVALGQSKMVTKPIAGFLHIIVYAGFVIINIEVLEILIDGLFGTHRVLSFVGPLYDILIGSFEVLALLVLLSMCCFPDQKKCDPIKRFTMRELTAWPRTDANLILITEILLMSAFLTDECNRL
jgi:hypothetical protein